MKIKTMVVFILCLAFMYLAAQDAWTAALYDNFSGEIVLVGQDGTVASQFVLPKPETGVYPLNVAVSQDGSVFAYVAYGEAPTLQFFNRVDGTSTALKLPNDMTSDGTGFVASPALFTSDAGLFAFSYSRSDGTWQIPVYDLRNIGDPVAILDQSAAIPGMLAVDVQGRSPIVQAMDDSGNVTFVLAKPFSGYQVNFETAFVWNLFTNEITRTGATTAVDGDVMGNERLTTFLDESLPNQAFQFAYPQANALYLTANSTERTLLFNTANLSMFWARFISDGERVLVGGYSPDNRATWLVLNRDGDVMGDFPPVQMSGVVGTADGFAYTVDAGANTGTLFYHVPVSEAGAGEPVELWVGAAGRAYRVIAAW